MGKWQNDLMLDAGLDYITSNCDREFVCTAQPTTYTEASVTYCLATATLTPGVDLTKENGDTSGRQFRVAAKSGVAVTATGDATHVALGKSGDSTLRFVTTCTTKHFDGGDQVNIPTWRDQIADVS